MVSWRDFPPHIIGYGTHFMKYEAYLEECQKDWGFEQITFEWPVQSTGQRIYNWRRKGRL